MSGYGDDEPPLIKTSKEQEQIRLQPRLPSLRVDPGKEPGGLR